MKSSMGVWTTCMLALCRSLLAQSVATAGGCGIRAFLDRSYYTIEPEAVVVCRADVAAEVLGASSLVVTREGEVLCERRNPEPETSLRFGIAAFPAGPHSLMVELRNRKGEVVAGQNLSLVKRIPHASQEWKVDRVRRLPLKNGKPVFSLALCYGINASTSTAIHPEKRERFFQALKSAGMDTFIAWAPFTDDTTVPARKVEIAREVTEKAGEAGLNAFWWLPSFATRNLDMVWRSPLVSGEDRSQTFPETYAREIPNILLAVRMLREFPNVAGYYLFDQAKPEAYLRCGQDLYRRTGEEDGYRLTFTDQHYDTMTDTSLSPEDRFTSWVDVLGRNVFMNPVQAAEGYDVLISQAVGFRRCGQRTEKPVWLFLTGETYSRFVKRALNRKEQLCQTYLALIYGARGIHYWTYPFLHRQTIETLSAAASQLRSLEPALLSVEPACTIRYLPETGRSWPDVPAALLSDPSGGFILLAANRRGWPVTVTYRLPFVASGTSVRPLFPPGTFVVKDGSFAEKLESYATRAYAIPASSGASIREIQVEMVSHPEAGIAEVFVPKLGRPATTWNIVCNSGFEDASLPGWPDFFWGRYAEPLMGGPDVPGWGQDMQGPYEGKYCLRMVNNLQWPNYVNFRCASYHTKAMPYVFSAFLKADREGVEIVLGGRGLEEKKCVLTTRWQRYWTKGVTAIDPNNWVPENSFGVKFATVGTRATVWVDALQVEEGEEPAEYES